jgi:hypothetical protein
VSACRAAPDPSPVCGSGPRWPDDLSSGWRSLAESCWAAAAVETSSQRTDPSLQCLTHSGSRVPQRRETLWCAVFHGETPSRVACPHVIGGRSFACASAFHRDRRVPVATPGRRWLLESCDASILGRGDGPSPIDAEAPTTPRGDPRGRRPCPTDRILGGGRRGRCPTSGLSSPETFVARLRSDGDIGGLGDRSRRQHAVVAGAEARHRRQRRSRGRAPRDESIAGRDLGLEAATGVRAARLAEWLCVPRDAWSPGRRRPRSVRTPTTRWSVSVSPAPDFHGWWRRRVERAHFVGGDTREASSAASVCSNMRAVGPARAVGCLRTRDTRA